MKRLIIYDWVISIIFILGIILDLLNELIFDEKISKEFVSYFFWFSIGLWIGSKIYKSEIMRMWEQGKLK
jgi:hypothetical protein